MPRLRRAQTRGDFERAQALFREYVRALDFDLDFQGVQEELDELPGPYAAPEGAVLLAEADGEAVGVVAVQPLETDRICEMKRLYVKPEYRERGIGRRLAEEIVEVARRLGYQTMRLDTVASMTAARSLYRELGFEERPPYYENPLDDVIYMERSL